VSDSEGKGAGLSNDEMGIPKSRADAESDVKRGVSDVLERKGGEVGWSPDEYVPAFYPLARFVFAELAEQYLRGGQGQVPRPEVFTELVTPAVDSIVSSDPIDKTTGDTPHDEWWRFAPPGIKKLPFGERRRVRNLFFRFLTYEEVPYWVHRSKSQSQAGAVQARHEPIASSSDSKDLSIEEHPLVADPNAESTGKSQVPTASPVLQPGNPLFKNPFSDESDSRHSLLAPYFQIMESFQTLAEEYPDVSALWKAEFGLWRVWPLPYRDAKVLSEHLGGSEEVPYSPGADLHLAYNAIKAEQLIVDAGIKQDQLNKILTRDRWLATQRFNASDLWLHSIREFWLGAREDAEASRADLDTFENVAEANGYVPGTSTAVGRWVWSLMVSQHKAVKQIVKERQLSTGDEIERNEEPAGWLESGKIPRVFAASVYFCGVLAARLAGELSDSQGSSACVPSKPAAAAQPALDLAGDVPHFVFRYGQDFPTEDQEAIETVRLEANRKYAAKSVSTFEEWMSAREEWLSELVYGAAPVFGRVSVKLHWSADHRRDVLKDFIIQAAAGHVTLPRVQRFFAPPRAKQLDDALFPLNSLNTAEAEKGAGSTATQPAESISQNPTLLNHPAQPTNSGNEPPAELIQRQAAEPLAAPSEPLSEQLEDSSQTPQPAKGRKTPEQVILEYKVLNKIRTHELVAEKLQLERSVYFEMKAGRKVSEETYVKAALVIGCSPDDLKP